jgi:hypothetical protein
MTLTALEGAEIITGKDPDTRINFRIKPLALTNDHGRNNTVTPERALTSVGEYPLRIAVKSVYSFHFRNGRYVQRPF